MNPVKLIPAKKDYIWGGTRLMTEFGKPADGLERIAETWELSCHADGLSVVSGGEYDGYTLLDALSENPGAIGKNGERFNDFPVLIKMIDAMDNLSVQVHPDDRYAREKENSTGKTEAWIILDCEPGASLLYGFKETITAEQLREGIKNNTLMNLVNAVPVKKGDVFFIEAGTMHAIGKGILIAEVQQSSNLTYRIYDYGRVDNYGNPRELHVEKALEVTTLTPPSRPAGPCGEPEVFEGYTKQELAKCKYFNVTRYDINGCAEICAGDDSFNALLCTDGSLTLNWHGGSIEIGKGDSVFVPANTGVYSCAGNCSVLITTI